MVDGVGVNRSVREVLVPGAGAVYGLELVTDPQTEMFPPSY